MSSKFTPFMESISISMTDVKNSMEGIGQRLQNIEDTQNDFVPRAECGNIVLKNRRKTDKVDWEYRWTSCFMT